MAPVQPDPNAPLEIGDYVTIADHPGALTWQILTIYGAPQHAVAPFALIESGQTGRRQYEPLHRLKLYRKATA